MFFIVWAKKGAVVKIVKFTQIAPFRFDLGLADFENGKLTEGNLSNNFDAWMVLATVVHIIGHFADAYPNCEIAIFAVDERRLKIYNAILRKKAALALPQYWIWGIHDDDTEQLYLPEQNDRGFVLKKKNI